MLQAVLERVDVDALVDVGDAVGSRRFDGLLECVDEVLAREGSRARLRSYVTTWPMGAGAAEPVRGVARLSQRHCGKKESRQKMNDNFNTSMFTFSGIKASAKSPSLHPPRKQWPEVQAKRNQPTRQKMKCNPLMIHHYHSKSFLSVLLTQSRLASSVSLSPVESSGSVEA